MQDPFLIPHSIFTKNKLKQIIKTKHKTCIRSENCKNSVKNIILFEVHVFLTHTEKKYEKLQTNAITFTMDFNAHNGIFEWKKDKNSSLTIKNFYFYVSSILVSEF